MGFSTAGLVLDEGDRAVPYSSLFSQNNLACDDVDTISILYGHTYSKSMDQPGKVANPARDQLNREDEYFPVRVRA